MKLHPASLLLAWLSLVLLLQWLPLPHLLGLALLVLPLAAHQATTRLRQLLRRTRWLLLSIALLFALATPGHALPAPLGHMGLTHEGLQLALLHGLRLTLLLGLLALLLEHLGIPLLIAGLYTLLTPLGSSPRRSQMALRLLLVLEYVEQGRALRKEGQTAGWRYWLAPDDLPSNPAQAHQDYPPVTLELTPLNMLDRTVMLLTLAALTVLGILLNT
ncbi:MAG: hypothetical protein KBD60_08055 [Sterolibacterium sp.]|nr:hypothetical protein [Sterolibacterium sp.]